jgi:hypothetical protein
MYIGSAGSSTWASGKKTLPTNAIQSQGMPHVTFHIHLKLHVLLHDPFLRF